MISSLKGDIVPGLVLTVGLAGAAIGLHELPFSPFTLSDGRHPIDAILIAIVLGAVLRNLFTLPRWLFPGVRFSVLGTLPIAIILLGARLDFYDVVRLSASALMINVICVAVAMTVTLWLCARLQVKKKLALLVAVGTAICGGTAIVVTAPIIEAEEQDTAFAVTTVTMLGLATIFAFPVIGGIFSLSQHEFGVWAGTSIHATPQVLAAGYSYGQEAGDVAVIVKLVRVLLLAPIVVGIGIWYARHQRRLDQAHVSRRTSFTTLVPPFIVGFVLLALANTVNLIPDFTLHLEDSPLWGAGSRDVAIHAIVTSASSFLVTVAMVGIGLGVEVKKLAKTGPQAVYVGVFASVVLATTSLLLMQVLL